jgi:hypothetical protein
VKKISSRVTVFHKRIFPLLWFGFLAFFLVALVFNGAMQKAPMIVLAPLVMAVFGYVLMKKLVWNLADEVYDGGDSLLVRIRGEEEMIPLSNIMNVSASPSANPQTITLRLVTPGKFGSDVAFSPVTGWTLNPFARNPVADDLIVRVDAARSRRRG